jgi:hypothetical protein
VAKLAKLDGDEVARKAPLLSKVDTAEGLKEAAYTAESWAALTDAVTAAKAILIRPDATQPEVDAAIVAIDKAISALRLKGSDGGSGGSYTGGGVGVTIDAAPVPTAATSAAKPAAPKKLEAPKAAAGKKQIKITWKKPSTKGISGYQIQYRVVGKNWTMKKIGAKATSLTIKKLQPGKKYEVRVRAFKKSGNKTVYGPWSKTMKSGTVKR